MFYEVGNVFHMFVRAQGYTQRVLVGTPTLHKTQQAVFNWVCLLKLLILDITADQAYRRTWGFYFNFICFH